MKVNKKKTWQSGQKYNHKAVTNPVKLAPGEPIITIWTDGSCLVNPGGEGTWAFIVVAEDKIIYEESGWEKSTTNNRMELTAAKKAIEYCMSNIKDIQVVIHMDSDYTYSSITKWMRGWHRKNYVNGNEERKNADIFRQIHPLLDQVPNVQYKWVKAHVIGEQYNNRADELCQDTYSTKADAGWKPYTQPTTVVQEEKQEDSMSTSIGGHMGASYTFQSVSVRDQMMERNSAYQFLQIGDTKNPDILQGLVELSDELKEAHELILEMYKETLENRPVRLRDKIQHYLQSKQLI